MMILLPAVCVSTAAAGAEVSPADRDVIDKLVRAQVGTGRSVDDQPVEEYREARRYAIGTGPHGAPYVVAQYTIETGNTWQLYLAVVDTNAHKVVGHGRVGGKGYREATVEEVREGVVAVKMKYYGTPDAMCCPTVAGKSLFAARDGGLWELDTRIECGARKDH